MDAYRHRSQHELPLVSHRCMHGDLILSAWVNVHYTWELKCVAAYIRDSEIKC